MARNKLAQLLLEHDTLEHENESQSNISKFGLEQITNIHETIAQGLYKYDPNRYPLDAPYDPLVEIAKLGITSLDENIQFKCHSKLAEYKYPQVKGIEISAKADREIKVSIHLADYAKADTIEIEPEDIEADEPTESEERDYVQRVLGTGKKLD